MLDFSKNYFELFGLPVAYAIDAAALSSRYRDLQRAIHPDRYAAGSDRERRLSLQGAGHVNQAFETLKDPLARADYLLDIKGGAAGGAHGNTADAAFLMEQMALREELEDARQQPDPHAAVAELMLRIVTRIEGLLDEAQQHFDTDSQQSLGEIPGILNKLRFLYRLRAQAEELEEELDEAL